jgi:hypothetical protein
MASGGERFGDRMPGGVNGRKSVGILLTPLFEAAKSDMMRRRIVFPTVVAATLICASLSYGQEGGVSAGSAVPIDATLYTRYNIDSVAHLSFNWAVCGSLPGSSGCYGSGTLGPFGTIGALLESEPKTDLIANTVTRAIYVVDDASGPNQNEVVLYVYTKVDTITTDSDTVTVTLSQTISLPLVGGGSTQISVAANKQFLFIGTDRSPYAVEINKRTFSVTQVGGGFSPPINVSAITANQYGYVTLSFGSFRSAQTGFNVIGPNGSDEEDGVGSQVMLNTDQAIKIAHASAGIQAPVREGISDFLPARLSSSRRHQKDRVPAAPAAPIDTTLYTRYNMDLAHTSVSWNVCGSLPGSSGCYGSGSLGPFGQAGALLEGEPKTDLIANTVTRAIYVLDIASGTNQDEVVLYVYTKVDTITTDSDTVTVTLSQTISLPLIGGLARQPSMAANKQFLFIGTDRSPYAVEINKRTFSVTQVGGGFSPPINVYGILTNQYGYVALSFDRPGRQRSGRWR